MGKKKAAMLAWVLCIFLFSWTPTSSTSEVYIVYMGGKVHEDPDITADYNHQILAAAYDGSMDKAKSSMVYSYRHGFRGFAAQISDAQAAAMAKMPGVVSVFPNKKRNLHTTHSWEFLGMPNDNSLEIPNDSTRLQENVIIGIIDTGIWPESPSFSDDLMSPVPFSWKGVCQSGELFPSSTCNRKLIGARYYLNGLEAEKGETLNTDSSEDGIEFRSARDSIGHGSHTASTAAGRYVSHMNYNGLAAGGARGGAPLARIAVYKTCWESGCYDSDILAAFDDAIKDGVDILSLSLGPDVPENDYLSDAIAVGSFHATQKGITVVCSVGNDGSPASATNLAPWVITVAASSTDRNFISTIILSGTDAIYSGESLNSENLNSSARLLSAADAHAKYFTPYQSSFCLNSSLEKSKVTGKILVCLHPEGSSETRVSKSQTVQAAGGVGMILIDEIDKNLAVPFVIPSAIVGDKVGAEILHYINSTRFPQAYISPAETVMGFKPAPQVAAFSKELLGITQIPEKGENGLKMATVLPNPHAYLYTYPLYCNRKQARLRVRAVAEAEADSASAIKLVKNEEKENKCVRVVFGAGGTGGHVYPAIAIADEMKAIHPNVEMHFVGTLNRLEWKAVPAAGYPILPIPAVALKRPFLHPTNILLPFKFLNCLWECWKILGQLRPELVVGTGGYVSAPICLMAALRGIRVAIQEQNVSPGIANKLLGVFATVIFVAFPASVDLFPKGKCVVSGNPIRPALRKYVSRSVARSYFFPGSIGSSQAEVVLILGGSLGANSINIAVLEMYSQMLSQHPNRCIIWQTGNDNFDEMDSLVRGHPRLALTSYLNNMDLAYAAADLVIARSGAMTCSELLATGKPSILIPSTYVAEDHQVKNATFMSEAAGAKLLYEDELDSTTLANYINDILGDENLMMDMCEKALKTALPDAAAKIAETLLSLVGNGH